MKKITFTFTFAGALLVNSAFAAPKEVSPACAALSGRTTLAFQGPSAFLGIPVGFKGYIDFGPQNEITFEEGFGTPSWSTCTLSLADNSFTCRSGIAGSLVTASHCTGSYTVMQETSSTESEDEDGSYSHSTYSPVTYNRADDCIAKANLIKQKLTEMRVKLPRDYKDREKAVADIKCAEERVTVFADTMFRSKGKQRDRDNDTLKVIHQEAAKQ